MPIPKGGNPSPRVPTKKDENKKFSAGGMREMKSGPEKNFPLKAKKGNLLRGRRGGRKVRLPSQKKGEH